MFVSCLGCSAGRLYFPYEYQSKLHGKGKVVLLEPTLIHPYLLQTDRDRSGAVNLVIRHQLTQAGYTVLPEETYRQLMATLVPLEEKTQTETIEVVKEKPSKREILNRRKQLLGMLEKEKRCDFIVSSGLAIRSAEALGTTARWDGVVRRIQMDTSDYGPSTRHYTKGYTRAWSVVVTVENLQGGHVFGSAGGLEVRQRQVRKVGEWRHIDRDDILANPSLLSAAVSTALHPFVSNPDYPDTPKYFDPPYGNKTAFTYLHAMRLGRTIVY